MRVTKVKGATSTICEGERIYNEMAAAMLSAPKDISGTVAMNYALSKIIANYRLAMLNLDIDVADYLKNMAAWWERRLHYEEAEDHVEFYEFAMKVAEDMLKLTFEN